jgi:hypothetical protein
VYAGVLVLDEEFGNAEIERLPLDYAERLSFVVLLTLIRFSKSLGRLERI